MAKRIGMIRQSPLIEMVAGLRRDLILLRQVKESHSKGRENHFPTNARILKVERKGQVGEINLPTMASPEEQENRLLEKPTTGRMMEEEGKSGKNLKKAQIAAGLGRM